MALTGFDGTGAAASAATVAQQREDGMYVAEGLVYTVADGGLAFVGFDDAAVSADANASEGASASGVLGVNLAVPEPENEEASSPEDGTAESGEENSRLAVPAAIAVDGKELPVVAIDLAAGQVDGNVKFLEIPSSIKNVKTEGLAAAFPALTSIDVAVERTGASAAVLAGAAAAKAPYAAANGILYEQTAGERSLVWAPPAMTFARIPADCRSIAAGAFTKVANLETVIVFGVIDEIAPGAFTDEQIAAIKVIAPAEATATSDGERVSADLALSAGESTAHVQDAWKQLGVSEGQFAEGVPYGTETVTAAVSEEGAVVAEAVALAGYEPLAVAADATNATNVENGLAFAFNSDMTLAVRWAGDPTATPVHIDIPSSVTIDGINYPVTTIADEAFKGAVFLTSITIPDTITTIGKDAFAGCENLSEGVGSMYFPLGESDDLSVVQDDNAGDTVSSNEIKAYKLVDSEREITSETWGRTLIVNVFVSNDGIAFDSSSLYSYGWMESSRQSGSCFRFVFNAVDSPIRFFLSDTILSYINLDSDLNDIPGAFGGMVKLVTKPGWTITGLVGRGNQVVDSGLLKTYPEGVMNISVVTKNSSTGDVKSGFIPENLAWNDASLESRLIETQLVLGDSSSGLVKDVTDLQSNLKAAQDRIEALEKAAAVPNAFFTDEKPLDASDAGGATQTSVIEVKLSESEDTVQKLTFVPNDTTGLINAAKLTSNTVFTVGTTKGGSELGTCGWGGSVTPNTKLGSLGDGKGYGVWVTISVPKDAINKDKVTKSYAAGDYVASLVKLEYQFA